MSNHLDDRFLKKHVKTSSTGGGACLTRHEKRQKNNSCSHIWQAYEKAEAEESGPDSIYNYPRYKSLVGKKHKSGARMARKGIFPRGLKIEETGPQPNEWDLGKPGNFQSWTKPYWHNAHHIIPNAILAECITEAASESWRLYLLIRAGLLEAEYNLNHMVNMIILPMAEEVARGLRLPRHLLGPEGGETRSHKNYSRGVKDRLSGVMDDYLAILDKKKEGHPTPPNSISKEKLEQTSTTTYKDIKAFGESNPGAALSEMFPAPGSAA